MIWQLLVCSGSIATNASEIKEARPKYEAGTINKAQMKIRSTTVQLTRRVSFNLPVICRLLPQNFTTKHEPFFNNFFERGQF